MFVAVFWSLWDQSGGEWVLQADKMDLHFAGITWLPSQIQAVNAIMILAFIPLFQYLIYPAISRVFPLTPLRKIGLGLVVTGASFLVSAWIETQLRAGLRPNIGWQLPAYALLTAGEIMVSITSLEFSYTQAPKKMKSIIMAVYLWSISAGNAFTALVHLFIQNPGRHPEAGRLVLLPLLCGPFGRIRGRLRLRCGTVPRKDPPAGRVPYGRAPTRGGSRRVSGAAEAHRPQPSIS